MPELPEVEIVKRQLEQKIVNQKITSVIQSDKKMRFNPDKLLCAQLENEVVSALLRRNKYIIIETKKFFLVFHLGMSGQIKIKNLQETTEKHQHITINFENFALALVDPRRFGGFIVYDKKNSAKISDIQLFKNLGFEPFSNDFTVEKLKNIMNKNNENIKHFLLNAQHVCGIGNIYASEILFETHISPFRTSNSLSEKEIKLLYKNIKKVLQKAIDNGGSSISDYVHINGSSGNMQNLYYVYSRQDKDCKVCNTKIKKEKQFGRSTYFCPNCQN